MAGRGRPRKEFNVKQFQDLIGLGCTQDEIAWFFRDETGKPANIDTLSRWCKRTFGLNFQDYYKKNGAMAMKIALRRNQIRLSEKSASMAIFLGKNFLGQVDYPDRQEANDDPIDALFKRLDEESKEPQQPQTASAEVGDTQ